MNDSSYWVFILLSIAIGMAIALLIRPKDRYHGPNALAESKKIYLNRRTNKCFHFAIQPLNCPNSKLSGKKFLIDNE